MTPAEAKTWRKETQRTQEAVAKLLGITRGAYALWEQGRAVLGKPRLGALAALSGQKETATLRQGVEGLRRAVGAWHSEVERVIPKMPAPRILLATEEVHTASLGIIAEFMKKQPLTQDEFLALHAKIVMALA